MAAAQRAATKTKAKAGAAEVWLSRTDQPGLGTSLAALRLSKEIGKCTTQERHSGEKCITQDRRSGTPVLSDAFFLFWGLVSVVFSTHPRAARERERAIARALPGWGCGRGGCR